MTKVAVRALVTAGEILSAPPDPELASKELEVARRHVESAAGVSSSDPVGAFALGYDAVRKAISAHMRDRGFRVAKGAGHHVRVGRYAVAALDSADVTDHLLAFDELRLLRNQSEYEGLGVEPSEVEDLLTHARAILAAVEEDLAR